MLKHTCILCNKTKQIYKKVLTHILIYGIIISTRRKQINGGTKKDESNDNHN